MTVNLPNTSFNSSTYGNDVRPFDALLELRPYGNNNFYDFVKSEDTTTPLITDPTVENIRSFDDTSPFILSVTVLYSTLIITSLISNPILIYVLLIKRKKKIKIVEIFVANLSLSDLLLTIFNIPLSLIIYFRDEWPFGSLLCKVATYSTSCSIYVNILTMTYISIDRYFAITRCHISNPSSNRTRSILSDSHMRHKIYTALTVIWIVALVLSLPQFLFTSVSKSKKSPFLNKDIAKRSLDQAELFLLDKDYKEEYESFNEMDFQKEFSEDPFKKCLLSYPIPNMKIYMTFVNFSFQYLIPLIVILYFYGKIIYHLYLNLNIAEFKDSTTDLSSCQPVKDKAKKHTSSLDLTLNNKSHTVRASSPNSIANQEVIAKNKNSKMRIEGTNRTKNLKNSIKIMVIIIALFLLSWLPIHLYRLVTTYVPLIREYIASSESAQKLLDPELYGSKNRTLEEIENCRKTHDKNCEDNVILREITSIKVAYSGKDAQYHTLHNPYVFFISYFMSMSSVCYNPIVYFWMHKKFRTEVKQTLANFFNFRFRFRKRTGELFSSFRSSITTKSSSYRSNANAEKPKKAVKVNPAKDKTSFRRQSSKKKQANDDGDECNRQMLIISVNNHEINETAFNS